MSLRPRLDTSIVFSAPRNKAARAPATCRGAAATPPRSAGASSSRGKTWCAPRRRRARSSARHPHQGTGAVGPTPPLLLPRCHLLHHLMGGASDARELVSSLPTILTWSASTMPPRTLGRVGAGGRHQERLLLARELALSAGARLLAERRLQVAFDDAAFGPVRREPPTPTLRAMSSSPTPASAASRICARFSLRAACLPPLSTRSVPHARPGSGRSGNVQSSMPPRFHGTDESDAWPMSTRFRLQLNSEAESIFGLHPRLHLGARSPASRSRYATTLPRHPALGPPNDPYPRAKRPHPPTARRPTQHRGVGRS